MPIISMDLKHALTDEQAHSLGADAVEAVHAAIGSATAHINVIIRHAAGTRIIESGGVHEAGS
ncbi:hypothetical protein [Rhodococcus indonesiensis]